MQSDTKIFKDLEKSLTDCLKLPIGWTFETTTDAVILGIRMTISSMIIEAYTQYSDGHSSAFVETLEKLNKVIGLLSQFILEKIKGDVHDGRKGTVGDEKEISISLFVSNNDSQAMSEKRCVVSRKEAKTATKSIKRHQILLVNNLIQIVSSEVHFLQQLKEIITNGFNIQQANPFIYNAHPKLLYEDGTLNLSFGEFAMNYGYEYQGALEKCYLTINSERCLHWLACGVQSREFGFSLCEKVVIFFLAVDLEFVLLQ